MKVLEISTPVVWFEVNHASFFQTRASLIGPSENSTSLSRRVKSMAGMTWTTFVRMLKAKHRTKCAPTLQSFGNEKKNSRILRKSWRKLNEERPRFNGGSALKRHWRLR